MEEYTSDKTFEELEDMFSVDKYSENRLNNAKKESIGSSDDKVPYSKHKVDKTKYMKAFIMGGLSIAVATIALSSVIKLGKKIKEDMFLQNYSSIVSVNTHRTSNNEGYWYDIDAIANQLLQEEDISLALYGVYNKIGYNQGNKNLQMASLLNSMKFFAEYNNQEVKTYSSFDDFLITNGFVDKEGNPSTRKYEEAMDNYVTKVMNGEKLEDPYFSKQNDLGSRKV